MTEAWDDLANFRDQRSACVADVAFITSDCARDHPQHKHVLECRECYEKVIDRMRSRYLDPKEGVAREWFTGQDAFLRDLDELFAAVRQYKATLEEVDAQLEEGRKAWYAQRVRASPSICKAMEELVDKREVLAKVGAKDIPFEETVVEIRKALEGSVVKNKEHGAQDVQETLRRLMAAHTPEEKTQVYRETFFQSTPDEPVSAKTQMYLGRLQDGATMDEIIDKISVDRRSSIGAMDKQKALRIKADELRRAKSAHELLKTKKARQDSITRPQPPEKMYNQPPCHACGRQVDPQEYSACPLCQVLEDKGVLDKDVPIKATVFCSAACASGPRGQDAHMEEAHDCAGGEYCAQLIDDDIDMDMHASGPYLCHECINAIQCETVFCSLRCADINFQNHRDGVHVPERKLRKLNYNKDVDSLVFDREDRGRYRAREIRVHMAPLEELLHDFQQRNAVGVAENGYHEKMENY